MPNTISLPLYHPHSLSSAINCSCNRYRYISARHLRLFNNSYGGFAPRTYHRFSLIAFISYLGRNTKLVLRITTEQKSSTAIRVRTSCYWDSFVLCVHNLPPNNKLFFIDFIRVILPSKHIHQLFLYDH